MLYGDVGSAHHKAANQRDWYSYDCRWKEHLLFPRSDKTDRSEASAQASCGLSNRDPAKDRAQTRRRDCGGASQGSLRDPLQQASTPPCLFVILYRDSHVVVI